MKIKFEEEDLKLLFETEGEEGKKTLEINVNEEFDPDVLIENIIEHKTVTIEYYDTASETKFKELDESDYRKIIVDALIKVSEEIKSETNSN